MTETETERDNARAAYCPLIVKRAGTTDPGRWWAYVTIADFLMLTDGRPTQYSPAPVCLTVESFAILLRYAGFGTKP